uniref:FG-GAP-like repeat-containing protein n=1 Tax=Thiolapillus sp. TaxID=2017437 RepID=UPI003AF7BC2B
MVRSDISPPVGDTRLVASLPGEFGVSPRGGAGYSIPLELPPGRGALTPQLGLQYNSQAGNGLLGVGWSLSGLSNIHRCNRTLAQDGFPAGVELSRADALCLDGRRLRVVSGTEGEAGSVYRPEVDDYTKVEMLQEGSLTWFKVWTKSGEIMEYGRTPDANISVSAMLDGRPYYGLASLPRKTRRWALNKVTDTVGNYYTLSYVKAVAGATHQISRIDYSGNVGARYAPHASVRFNYQSRPDKTYGYVAQSRIRSTHRLASVAVYEGAAHVRSYFFDYLSTDYVNPKSRLGQIRLCVDTAATQCVAPTLVEWYSAATPKVDNGFAAAIVSHRSAFRDSKSRDAAQVLDFNGDGIADLVYPNDDGGRLTIDLYDAHGSVSANHHFLSAERIPFVEGGPWPYSPFIPMDADADGKTDILVPITASADYTDTDGDTRHARKITGWRKYAYDAANNTLSVTRLTIADTAGSWGCDRLWVRQHCAPLVLDANGDGRQDLLYPRITGADSGFLSFLPSFKWELLLQNSTGGFTNVGSTGLPTGAQELLVIDMNGDGRQDLFSVNNYLYLSQGRSFTPISLHWGGPAHDSKSLVIDINGDGYQDIVWFYRGSVKYRLNQGGTHTASGTGSFAGNPVKASLTEAGSGAVFRLLTDPADRHNDPQSANPIDWDKDGVTDIILAHKKGGVRHWWVLLTRFDSQGNPRFEAIDTGADASGIYRHHPLVADFNGDGLADLVVGHQYKWQLHKRARTRGDLVRRITAGRGRSNDLIEIEYASLSQGIHTARSNTPNSPHGWRYFQAPMSVVSQVKRDAGQGGVHEKRYRYEGARTHTEGRGFQGFSRQIITDMTAGLIEYQDYLQQFPYTGNQLRKIVRRSADSRLISRTDNTWNSTAWNRSKGRIEQPYLSVSVQKHYDLASGVQLSKTTTTQSNRDLAGNFQTVGITTVDSLSNRTQTKTTQSRYQNKATHWLMGRLLGSTVTHSGSAYGAAIRIRKSSFSYNMRAPAGQRPNGLLHCETIEPDHRDSSLSTCYSYDAFGNQKTQTISGSGIISRTTTTAHDAGGRFPSITTNALGQQETYRYNSRYGFRTRLTGPNGLTTTWTPDALGRLQREDRADGTHTRITYEWGNTDCPTGTVYRILTTATGQPASYRCYDKKGRVIGEAIQGFDGRYRRTDTQYDVLGRVARVSRPFILNRTPAGWTVTTYDILNRPTEENSPVTGSTAFVYGTWNDGSHIGQSILSTNALEQSTLTLSNGFGEKIAVRDALNNWTTFGHTPTGNVASITGVDGSRTTLTYNRRGEKIQLDDPDLGTWRYDYNVLGELISQTDAKSQVLKMRYDRLGRMTLRYLNGQQSATQETWGYDDTISHGKALGKLTTETAPGITRHLDYDGLGRPWRTRTTISGTTYTASQSYDGYGRLSTKTLPGDGLTLNYSYNSANHLQQVADASPGGLIYWKGITTNADGQFTQEQRSGITGYHTYNAATGRLSSIVTASVQNLHYTFDSLGNLTQRKDLLQNKTENFVYDSLNRLTGINGSAGVPRRSFSYYANGNIRSKDNHTYQYNNTRHIHAVTDDGLYRYSYDANGNMQTGAGRSLTWDHRNRLTQATKGGVTSSFAYDANGARYQQTRTTTNNTPWTSLPCNISGQTVTNAQVPAGDALDCGSSTGLIVSQGSFTVNNDAIACFHAPLIQLKAGFSVKLGGYLRAGSSLSSACNSHIPQTETIRYLGGVEQVTHPNGSLSYRHLIQANGQTVAIHITHSNSPTETRVLFHDHIGSLDVITDANGNIKERPSFEAWGNRRASDWSTNPASTSDEPRGFTGHEHLNGLGLIHMNGRVYDPSLGRFLSPDTVIQFPNNSQSYNRYSYVLNNPLSYTDPSGHF